ncbi:hypothetical protein [Nonomuraea wenchangensis]|uniref:hypothetical protein n=1 Tax=Nonomuraea wenchangensis TaxID=568860 RepID=UPI003411CC64
MREREEHERFGHLARLGWDLRGLGYDISLVLPAAGSPTLQMCTKNGAKFHITANRRYYDWVFTWRPWWARLWRRDRWVMAHADNAAAVIAAEVNA